MSNNQQDLYNFLQKYIPPPVAWILSFLILPFNNLIKAIPDIMNARLAHKREEQRMKMEQEKWELEKAEILRAAEEKKIPDIYVLDEQKKEKNDNAEDQ